jgi:hypothetical protein
MPRPVSDGASEIRPPPGARRLLVKPQYLGQSRPAAGWKQQRLILLRSTSIPYKSLSSRAIRLDTQSRIQTRSWLQNLDDELMYLIGSMKELNCPVYLCRLNRSTQHRR